MASTANTQTGYLGSLTPEQTYKLKELWLVVLTALDSAPKGLKVGGKPPSPEKKGGRFGFGQKTVTADEAFKEAVAAFLASLQGANKAKVHSKIRDMIRADHPDQMLLRFLRARKWDLPRAAEMLGKTVYWRTETCDVEQLLERGEIYYIDQEPDPGFIDQYKVGKSVLVGHDKNNRPVMTIQVKKHDPRAQSEEAMRRYVLFNMECGRLCLKGKTETAGVIFDLGGFGLHNMDYAVVKFLIECFEAHYPESLGYLYIHRAPWIFSGVWNIIKGWIDPVVASKIAFTKNEKDLLKNIPGDQIPTELGGSSKEEYVWIPPVAAEDAPLKDTETRQRLLAQRNKEFDDFDKLTLEWVQADGEASSSLDTKRNELVHEIETNYWKLDPYVRSRTIYDRNGRLGTFKPELAPGGVSQPLIKSVPEA